MKKYWKCERNCPSSLHLGSYVLMVFFAASCSSSPSGQTAIKGALSDSCKVDSDCASGVCVAFTQTDGYIYGYCSTSCDAGCDAKMTCGTAPDGSQKCMYSCNAPDQGISGDFACRNNVPIACAVVPDQTYCSDCGCPSELRCEPGVGCQERRELGGVCKVDSDCKSNNCSSYLGVCRVPVGTACTVDNCDLCETDPANNSTRCTTECSDDSECNGGYCLGNGNTYYCERPCSACSNSYECSYTSDYSIHFCDCTSCTTASAPRPLGIGCEADGQCVSNQCYEIDGSNGYGLYTLNSWCTIACTSDADCASAGLVCAAMPCNSGVGYSDPKQCGKICMRPCAADGTCEQGRGACRALPSPAGGTVNICDVRADNDAYCLANENCLSGRCTSNRCIPLAGAANGSSCKSPSDCASGNCQNSVCLGTSQIGDHCTTSSDCSVGCCSTSSVCATSC